MVVLRYYLQTEFGRLHSHNPEIRAIAARLDRTPDSVAMKAANYASLDPKITGTGRRGLSQASRLDREVWNFMQSSFEEFEEECAAATALFGLNPTTLAPDEKPGGTDIEWADDDQPTEGPTTVMARRKQAFFRQSVLAAYRNTCPITGISIPSLLNASHIIPWRDAESRRLDPSNGIALNAFHDRAFDRGLISFSNDLQVLVSSQLRSMDMGQVAKSLLQDIAGARAARPDRFDPDPEALEYHRDMVFIP